MNLNENHYENHYAGFNNKYEKESCALSENDDNEDEDMTDDEILDIMFPDRHDDDFDNESMNYDQVFNDD